MNNLAINQWLRRWILQPGISITCPCGYIIPTAPKSEWWSKKRRYNWMHERMLKHYGECLAK